MKRLLFSVFVIATLLSANVATANTTLAAGDIAFTGYNSVDAGTNANHFSFVILVDGGIDASTVINFTDNGWNPVLNSLFPNEGTVQWTSGAALAQFTEVTIDLDSSGTVLVSASHGSVTTSGPFILSGAGDQILAYQGSAGSPTFVAGIHMNSEIANGSSIATSAGIWDDITASGGWGMTAQRSALPPGLTTGVDAIIGTTTPGINNTERDNGVYNCTGAANISVAAIASSVNNPANWSFQNTTGYTLPGGCTFEIVAGLAPEITDDPTDSTVCAGNGASFTVAGTDILTYRWQVDNGGGFADVASGAPYSGETTATLSITGATAGLSGYAYRVIVTGALAPDDTSAAATLTVTSLSATSSQIDVSCNGAADGEATIAVTGGTGSYTYSWTSGGNAATETGLAAGSYDVVATDGNGCEISATYSITEPTAISTGTSQTNVDCNGGNNGSATVNASGGTPGYTYSWSPSGGTAATAAGLTAGGYTVQVTDDNGCTADQAYTITEPDALTSVNTQSDISCNGQTDGSAAVSVSGGSAPYLYIWSNLENDSAITGLIAGTYTVDIHDANGCSITETFTILEPAALTYTTAQADLECNGDLSGAAAVVVAGGTPAYTYTWAPNVGNTDTVFNIAAGNYTVDVEDANGCTVQAAFTITEPTALTSASSQVDVSCNGYNDGEATITVSGGIPPYTYAWAPSGGTDSTASGLVAGTYTVVATDDNGCTISETLTITEPSGFSNTTAHTDVTCNGGSDGSASVTVTGGTGPFTYLWSPVGGADSSATGLTADDYTIVITDANGCSAAEQVTVDQPSAIDIAPAQVNITCNGGNDGEADVAVSGGTPPYTYLWTPGGSTDSSVTGLIAGNYSVDITDDNGCATTHTFDITQPDAITSVNDQTNVLCNGNNDGTATVNVSGGTGPYTYLWTSGDTAATATGLAPGTHDVTITDANSCTSTESFTITEPDALTVGGSQLNVNCFNGTDGEATVNAAGGTVPYSYAWSPSGGTDSVATGLAAGTYTVVVTDDNGCSISNQYTLTEPAQITTATAQVDLVCNGDSNGSAEVTATGGTPGYTYLWSPSGSTDSTAPGLSAGLHEVVVTDGNGCTVLASVTIDQPDAIASNLVTTDISCNGETDGAAVLAASGGTPGYTYFWPHNNSTDSALTGLSAGTYTFEITDAANCTLIDSVTIVEPGAIGLTALASDVNCLGAGDGGIDLVIAGGTPLFTYIWSNGDTIEDPAGLVPGTYDVTVTDAHGCSASLSGTEIAEPATAVSVVVDSTLDSPCFASPNGAIYITASGGTGAYTYLWSTGAVTEDLVNAVGGSHTVTVTDANGCTVSETGTIAQPLTFAATGDVTAPTCNGDNDASIDLSVTGGLAPYTFLWSTTDTSEDISGLSAGIYDVTVFDDGGCSVSSAINVTDPDLVSGATVVTDVTCNRGTDGTIDLTPAGGTGPYTYLWSTGSVDEDVFGLTAGVYDVTITDANGCSGTVSATVAEPAALSAVIDVTNVTCNGLADGAVDLTVTDGTPGYTYLWNTGAVDEDSTGLAAGTYTVTVTDSKGCTATATADVTEPVVLTATAVATDISCNGLTDGAVDLTVNGGTAAYTYEWDNSEQTQNISGLVAGTYSVTVTDANLCTASASASVAEPAVLTASATSTDASCAGNDGTVDLTVTGGTAPYGYDWNDGSSDEDILAAIPGTYDVIVTDAGGCSATALATVAQPTAFPVTVSSTPSTCSGGGGGSVTATFTVTGAVVSYGWNTPGGANQTTVTDLDAGFYVFTLLDTAGCTTTLPVQVAGASPIVATDVATGASCNGLADGSIDLTVTGGAGTFTYTWDNGAGNSEDPSGLAAGDYSVTITDLNNCSIAYGPVTITEPDSLSPQLDSLVDVKCFGDSTGGLYVTISGGTLPYTYEWSNGSTDPNLVNVPEGIYTGTITDANGCILTTPQPIPISGPASALTANAVATDASCTGNDGTIDLTIGGGTPGYTVLWSNGSTDEDLSGLGAGTYTATITDANGCATTASATVNVASGLTASATTNDVGCNGDTTSIDLTVTGGTQPITYAWDSGPATEDLFGVTNGTYTVTVTDGGGCSVTASATVGVTSTLAVTLATTNNLCADGFAGTAAALPTGGVGPYTYEWSNTMNDSALTGLLTGFIDVTVLDGGGCSASASALITEPSAISVAWNINDISCYGLTDGSIALTVTGGTPGYTYAWDNSAADDSIGGLAAGTYTVTITDANACNVIYGPFTIAEPDSLSGALDTIVNVNCFGDSTGSISIIISGGASPYSYAWDNGGSTMPLTDLAVGDYNLTVTDANGCTITSPFPIPVSGPASAITGNLDTVINNLCNGDSTAAINITVTGGTGQLTFLWDNGAVTEDLSGLPAGTYTPTVTDALGCIFSPPGGVTITDPAAIVLTTTVTDVACQGGSDGAITTNVTGGTTPYSFVWSSGNGTGLTAGTYSVTVTDANGCSGTAAATVAFTNANPVVALGADQTVCGGPVTLDAGNAGAAYLWSNSGNTQTISVTASGTYSVIVTAAGGCVGTDTVVVTINPVPTITFDITATKVCIGAAAITLSATPTGGTFSGTGVSGTSFNPATAGAGPHTITYSVTANNCTNTATDNITVETCVGLEEVVASKVVLFPNPNNGSFTITIEGAAEPIVRCELFNELGQIIQTMQLSSDNSYSYTVGNVEAGVYFLATHNGEKTTTQRVLVVK